MLILLLECPLLTSFPKTIFYLRIYYSYLKTNLKCQLICETFYSFSSSRRNNILLSSYAFCRLLCDRIEHILLMVMQITVTNTNFWVLTVKEVILAHCLILRFDIRQTQMVIKRRLNHLFGVCQFRFFKKTPSMQHWMCNIYRENTW